MYSNRIINLFSNPSNVGIIQGASGVGTLCNKQTTETTKLYIKVEDETIVEASFKTYSNVVGIAIFSVLTDLITDLTIDEALEISANDITEKTGEIAESKQYLLDDAIECLSLAIKDYHKKQEKLQKQLNNN